AVKGTTRNAADSDYLSDSELKEKWQLIARKLQAELGEDLFSSWFARMEVEQLVDGRLVVSVPTRFLRNWVDSHYSSALNRVCQSELGVLESVSVVVRTRGLPTRQSHMPQSLPEAGQPANSNSADATAGQSANVLSFTGRGSPIDKTLSFETFMPGKSNALAHAAAMRVADATAADPLSFNPLFIHSAAGLGKTHLLNAISARITRQQPGRKVLYITAERFMYHFIAALKAKDVLSFKDFFQSIDVLMIDDFQFLQGKTMQQEFCHTFNSLVDAKRQVVVAADVPPAQLGSIDQRMRSRFAGGLVVDITSPELDLRRKILQGRLAMAQRKDASLYISDDVIEFIANRITSGGRELEGALNRVIASQQLTRARITVDLAALALRDMDRQSEPTRIRIEDILRIIGHHYSVTRADLLSPRRARSIVRPRQVGMYLAKKFTPRSLPEIGRRFGGRDHSTVLHAVRKIEDLMKGDDILAREVSMLGKLVEQRQ
ncbi:MAG TPA: chromosomal replication initiator protein DnaA, partial [Rhizobiales bacterium]|nr:chromosomal replication initiator protein DnaA [Hyphomicrobiales bacterium]